ncbi:MAG TPA: hypothetical protein VF494_11805 [Candidatus Limnocylindrales bacterium]
MDRSVAQGGLPDPDTSPWPGPGMARWISILVGVLLALGAMAIYLATRTDRYYDHFVWQAAAFLEGQAAIRYPVDATAGLHGNAYFQDVLPIATSDGVPRGLLPFPPLPAVVLLPFVALWGLATDAQTIFTILAAVDVAICWWALGALRIRQSVRLGTTIFFAVGTVFWYTAQVATTWYQAHVVAVGLSFLAIGIALRGDRAPELALEPGDRPAPASPGPWGGASSRIGAVFRLDRRQFVAGLLLGLATTARLTVVFGAPFLAFVGSGGGWRRRAWSAGVGLAIPIGALVIYNLVTNGHVFSPAYDYLYALEANGYPSLGYHPDWSMEDPRYLPQNFGIAFLGLPDVLPRFLPDSLAVQPIAVCTDPGAVRGLFDLGCPLAVPRDVGMSFILTSPAYLLAIPALGRVRRSRPLAGAIAAVVLITVANLMHFSQGWVQFGYRFSLDAAPFALVVVALGWERLVGRWRWGPAVAVVLLVASIAVNLWGVIWSRLLGW